MDERKIKDAYNNFELPNFPSAQDIIEKYNNSLTTKTKTNSYKWIIAYTLTMLIMIISTVFIRESTYTPPVIPTDIVKVNLTKENFGSYFEVFYETDQEQNLYLNIVPKDINDIENTNVTLNWNIKVGENREEFSNTFVLTSKPINYLFSVIDSDQEVELENINISSTTGNVLVTSEKYEEVLKSEPTFENFLKTLQNTTQQFKSYYQYQFSNHTIAYVEKNLNLKDYKDIVFDDFDIIKSGKAYVNNDELYYRYESDVEVIKKIKALLNYSKPIKTDRVAMNYIGDNLFINHYHKQTASGKDGVALIKYENFEDAKQNIINQNLYIDINNFYEMFNENNLNMLNIDIDYEKNDNHEIYYLKGKVNNFYLLDNKLFYDQIYSKVYYGLLNAELLIEIKFTDGRIDIKYEISDNQKTKYTDYDIKILYNESYFLEPFNSQGFDNYIEQEDKYTYLPADELEQVYDYSLINENIRVEDISDINKLYFKFHLSPGQYALEMDEITENSYRCSIYDENYMPVDLGLHTENVYFYKNRKTFVIEEEQTYYLEIKFTAGLHSEFNFTLLKLEDDTIFSYSNPTIIEEGVMNISLDTPYDMYYFDYYSEQEGLLNIQTGLFSVLYYTYNESNGLYMHNKLNKEPMKIKPGHNYFYVLYDPMFTNNNVIKTTLTVDFFTGVNSTSKEIEEMVEVKEEFLINDILAYKQEEIYLKLDIKQEGNYKFTWKSDYLDSISLVNVSIYDQTLEKEIFALTLDDSVYLQEGTYIIKITSYKSTTLNIKYEFEEE